MPLSLGWKILPHVNPLPWGFWVDPMWLSTKGATTYDYQKVWHLKQWFVLFSAEILFLDRNRHYGTEIANISTAQMLRASESQRKMAGMSVEYSVTGAEGVTRWRCSWGRLKSNRRESVAGLAAIYRSARCLQESRDQKLQQCEMRGTNEFTDPGWQSQSGTIHLPPVYSQVINPFSAEKYNSTIWRNRSVQIP